MKKIKQDSNTINLLENKSESFEVYSGFIIQNLFTSG